MSRPKSIYDVVISSVFHFSLHFNINKIDAFVFSTFFRVSPIIFGW